MHFQFNDSKHHCERINGNVYTLVDKNEGNVDVGLKVLGRN